MDSYTSNDLNELSMTGIGSLLGATEEDINALEVRVSTNESNIITLQGGLADEITNRENADTTLQNNINAEASTRASADTTLQTNIDAEASTRLANDNTLQTNIDAEASTRLTNDNTLQTNINNEASTRLTNDNTLQSNIDAEASTRAGADTTLQNNIDAEENARIAGDALKVNKSGDTMTGLLNLRADTNGDYLRFNGERSWLWYSTGSIGGTDLRLKDEGNGKWWRYMTENNTEWARWFFDNNLANCKLEFLGGSLIMSNNTEIYYKGETLDERFHSLDNDYYTEAESDARFVNVAGDTMTGNLTISKPNPSTENAQIIILCNGGSDDDSPHLYSQVFLGESLNRGAYYRYAESDNTITLGANNSGTEIPMISWGRTGADFTIHKDTEILGDLTVKGNSSNILKTTWNSSLSQFEVEYPTGTGLFFNNALSNPSLRLLDTKVQVYNGLEVLNGSLNVPNAGIDVAGSINIGYGQINANATFFDIATTNNTDYTFRVRETTSVFLSNLSVNGALTTTDAVQANEFVITNSTTGNTTRLGYLTLGGTYGVYIGHRAGGLNTNTQNTAVGYECMYSSTVARYSVCMGFRAGYHNRGDFNNFIGHMAGYGTGGATTPISGDYNIGIGYQTLQSLTTGYNNVCIGINSTTAITTGYRNVCLGDDTLRYSTTGQQNTVMGQSAMRGLNSSNPSNGSYNVAIGLHSQIYSSTGFHNTSVGYESMNGVNDATKLITGNYNTCIGRRSLFRITSGIQNTALGYMAMGGDNSAGVSGDNNVCVGMFSGYNITNAGYNTFLGYASGQNSTGSNNLFIGYGAGSNTSSVSHRVGIGFDAEPTEEKEILITAGASDKNQFQMLTDGMKWIFNGSTKMLMEIVSSVATYNFYGNLKVWIGNINTTGMYMIDDKPLLNVSFCAYQSDANPPTNTYINLHFLHPYVGSGESHLASTNAIRVAVFPRAFKIYAICLMLDQDTDMPLTTVKVEVFGNNKGTGSTTNTEVELEKDTSTQKTVVKNLTTPIEVPYGCFSAEVKHSTTYSNEGCVYFYGTQV